MNEQDPATTPEQQILDLLDTNIWPSVSTVIEAMSDTSDADETYSTIGRMMEENRACQVWIDGFLFLTTPERLAKQHQLDNPATTTSIGEDQ